MGRVPGGRAFGLPDDVLEASDRAAPKDRAHAALLGRGYGLGYSMSGYVCLSS